MSKFRTVCLAIGVCILSASCAMVDEGELDDQALSDEAEGEASDPEAADPATLAPAGDELACESRWQCQQCAPPYGRQVTAQRTYTECGAHGQLWEVIYLCSNC
jgi:hypothetical protein